MKVDPVKRFPQPSYPTKVEVMMDPVLFERHAPAAWLKSKHVACALASFIAVGSIGCTTACIAVTPPAYLSEEEALTVIREGLKGYGIELKRGETEIPAVRVEWMEGEVEGGAGESLIGPESADLEDPERRVVLEFVSAGDFREWTKTEPDGIRGGNELRKIAETMTVAVREEKGGEVYFGAMYDPAMWLPARSTEDERKERTRKYLRIQVEEFAQWLKAQGVI